MSDHSQPTPRRPWFGLVLAILGSGLATLAIGLVLALVMALLFWQLMANVVMVAFKQDLHWYGPGVYTAGGELWWWVFGFGAAGAVFLASGATILARAGTPWRPWRRGRGATA
ncbi:MAG: hypothetical protein ACT4QG_11630 [Sporichthyaceae bacterium]